MDFELNHTCLLLDCCDHHLLGPGPNQSAPRVTPRGAAITYRLDFEIKAIPVFF
jgi:hypothetical protein